MAVNILLLLADDMNYNTIGCFGCPVDDISPNLDRLASQMCIRDSVFTGEIPARCIQAYRTDLAFYTNGRSVCLTELKLSLIHISKISGLPLGKYYVKEKATVEGFVLDDEAREIDLTYRDQDTAEVTYSADWQNNRQKAEVEVVKKEKDSDHVLEGAVFALCAKEDITGADGKVILKADTVIEELATDKEGKLTFTADLPIGFAYYIKETSPASGFATTDEIQEFTFEYEGAEKEKVSYAFTFEDEPTVIEITKTSLTDGKELEGAKLQVTDESGKVVDSWTSGKEAHVIKEMCIRDRYNAPATINSYYQAEVNHDMYGG